MIYINDTKVSIPKTVKSINNIRSLIKRSDVNYFTFITDNIERAISFKKQFKDNTKIIYLTKKMNEKDLEQPDEVFICCCCVDQITQYINAKDRYPSSYKYKIIGNVGSYKFFYHLYFKGASFVQINPSNFLIKEAQVKSIIPINIKDLKADKSNVINHKLLKACVSKEALSKTAYELVKYLPKTLEPKFDEILPSGNIYIMKPTNTYLAFKGSGITVFTDEKGYKEGLKKIEEMKDKDPNTSYIIQEYIKDPLLFNDLKFHFRIFVKLMIDDNASFTYSYFPYFRICTSNKPFVLDDFLNPDIHDTHLSSTKDEYIFNSLEPNFFNNKVNVDLISDMIRCIYEMIQKKNCFQKFNDTKEAYFILGLDVMIKDDGYPLLLEINTSPSVAPIIFDKTYINFVKKYTEWVLN